MDPEEFDTRVLLAAGDEDPDPKGQSNGEDHEDDDAGDGPEDDGDADGGDEDAAGESDAEEGADAEDVGQQPPAVADQRGQPRQRSASDVIRDSKRQRREAEARAAEADRRAAEAERRAAEAATQAATRRREESAAEEAARLELMTADEKVNYYREKDRQENAQQINGLRFQVWDSTDRADFRQLVKDDPLVAKVKDKVEAEFARLVKEGNPIKREILADLEVGRMLRAERAKGASKGERQRAEAGVRREQVRAPARGRSDVATTRERRGAPVDDREARRKRLEDVSL